MQMMNKLQYLIELEQRYNILQKNHYHDYGFKNLFIVTKLASFYSEKSLTFVNATWSRKVSFFDVNETKKNPVFD